MSSKQTNIFRTLCVLPALLILFIGCNGEESGIRGSGTVEAREITVSARSQGEILSVRISEGQRTQKGDLLARIDDEDLRLQLEQHKLQLARLRANLELLKEGAEPEDIRQANAQLQQAEQAFELARSSYARTKNLHEGGSATPSELDRARTEFRQARAKVESAEAQLEKLETMPRPKEVESMEAQVAEAEVGIERLKRRIDDAAVTAPATGTVITAAREAGEYVTPGTPLFTLADLSEVYLTIFVSEPKLGYISLGQKAEVSVDGMPERLFTGTVSRIAEEAEFTPKNVQTQDARAELVFAVEITIDNSQGVFKIGMPADAHIEMEAE